MARRTIFFAFFNLGIDELLDLVLRENRLALFRFRLAVKFLSWIFVAF